MVSDPRELEAEKDEGEKTSDGKGVTRRRQPLRAGAPRGWSVRLAIWWLRRTAPEQLAAGTGGAQSDVESDLAERQKDLEREGPPRRPKRQSTLDRYRRLEEWSWRTEIPELRNLAWLLHAKHEEASLRADSAAGRGFWMMVLAALLAFGAAIGVAYAWHEVILPTKKGGAIVVPDGLWMVVAATTAAALLVGGAATLLFKVSRQFHDSAERASSEADFTRQIEASIRIILASKTHLLPDHDVRKALVDLSLRLLQRAPERGAEVEAQPAVVPAELLHEVKELLSARDSKV